MAERLAAIQPFFATQPEAIHPVVRQIISKGSRYTAVDTFKSFYTLEALKQQALILKPQERSCAFGDELQVVVHNTFTSP